MPQTRKTKQTRGRREIPWMYVVHPQSTQVKLYGSVRVVIATSLASHISCNKAADPSTLLETTNIHTPTTIHAIQKEPSYQSSTCEVACHHGLNSEEHDVKETSTGFHSPADQHATKWTSGLREEKREAKRATIKKLVCMHWSTTCPNKALHYL